MTNRRTVISALALGGGMFVATAGRAEESVREEARWHPRIAKAIHELEDAVRYMEAAPHDFGGFKAQAIADSRAAIGSLRKALAYRGEKDERHPR